jgi:integrase/recombinase XerD
MARSKNTSFTEAKYLSDLERDEFLAILRKYYPNNQRDCLVLFTLLQTGARATEILNVRKMDLYEGANAVFIRGLKGSRDRAVPIDESLFRKLSAFSEGLRGQELLFPIKYNRLRELWTIYRPGKCFKKIHSLRHTFAVRTYKHARDVKLVQRLLGHTTLGPTTIYMDFVEGTDSMRKRMKLEEL